VDRELELVGAGRAAGEGGSGRVDAVCGLHVGGVGITRPLVQLQADSDGGRLVPRWRWLGWLLFRDYAWSWSNVRRLELLIGPFGGVHGLRVALAERPVAKRRNGVGYPWFRRWRRFVVGLVPADVEALLSVAPGEIARTTRRGLFVWR
jgi:hypothetical protein